MLKMIIRMDDNKISQENRYRLDGVYNAIQSAFAQMGLPCVDDPSGYLVYRDNGAAQDYGRFGRIVNTLKRQAWFMDNVAVWLLCDSDGSDDPEAFSQEDLLRHYKHQRSPGA